MPNPPFRPTIPELIRHCAARYGDADAIVRDGAAISFAELDRQSRQVSKALVAQGVSKGARVAVLAPPGPDFVVAVLAAGRIGAIIGPLSTLYQAPELSWVLHRAEFDHLIIADAYLRHDYLTRLEQALPGLAGHGPEPLFLTAAPRLRRIHVIGEGQRSWSHAFDGLKEGDARVSDVMLEEIEALVSPADPACIIHTSGSTAEPKGVIHGHGPLVRHSWMLGTRSSPFAVGDRVITNRAMFWVAGFVATLFYALNNGSCLIMTDDGSSANVLRLIEQSGATGLVGYAEWFKAVSDFTELRRAGYEIVRLNMDSAGIARNGRFLSDQLIERCGTPVHHPDTRFARTFGMTETLGAHTTAMCNELLPEDRPNWQGRPVPGVEVKVVDPATRQELPAGEIGELLVRGSCLMLGLNGRERQETFTPDGFYATGDLCHMDANGYLKFEARLSEMLKVHGANVAPLEVELALGNLAGIEKAGVVGLPRDGDTMVVAGVVVAQGHTLDEAAMIAALKQALSSYKVPRRIVQLTDDQLPQTASGKIRKPELTALLATMV